MEEYAQACFLHKGWRGANQRWWQLGWLVSRPGNPWARRASRGQAADVASNSRRLAANHCTPSRAHLGKFALKIVSWESHIEGVPVATLSQVWGFSATVEKRGGSWGIACRQCCTSAGQSWLRFAFEWKLNIKDNPSLHLLKVYLANAGK